MWTGSSMSQRNRVMLHCIEMFLGMKSHQKFLNSEVTLYDNNAQLLSGCLVFTQVRLTSYLVSCLDLTNYFKWVTGSLCVRTFLSIMEQSFCKFCIAYPFKMTWSNSLITFRESPVKQYKYFNGSNLIICCQILNSSNKIQQIRFYIVYILYYLWLLSFFVLMKYTNTNWGMSATASRELSDIVGGLPVSLDTDSNKGYRKSGIICTIFWQQSTGHFTEVDSIDVDRRRSATSG